MQNIRKEVSCNVFTPTFEVLKRKNIGLNLTLKDVPYNLDHLLNKHERIEWSVLCTIIRNIRPYLSISDFEEMGAIDIREGFNQEYVASGLLMFSLNKLSRSEGENIVKSGEHNVTCIKGEIVSTNENSMKLKYYIDGEHEYFPEFVYVQRGGLLELGKLFGYKEFDVRTTWVHKGAIFEVSWKNKRTFFGFRKWFFWVFNFRKAFLDLTDSRTQLLNQFNKLEESKRFLLKQTTQLKTAHSLSTSVRQSLQMTDTLSTISDILTKEAGFDEVIINIFTDFENNQIDITVKSENGVKEVYKIINDIIVNDKMIGELIVFVRPNKDYLECKEMLEYLMPVINIVIHDALVLRAVIDYRNNLEQKVINRTLELNNARDELFTSNEQLKNAQKIQNNFFTNISHEFRTPLTLILGPTKQLIEKIQDADAKENLNLIYRSAKKLNRLVDELLDISKIETGEMKLKVVLINIFKLTIEVCSPFYSLAEKKKTIFFVNSSEKEILAYIDKNKFEKILNNVLSNAFKFTPEGGIIEVAINCQAEPDCRQTSIVSASSVNPRILNQVRDDKIVEISIRDTGIGIPKNQIEKIFDRFYQVDISSSRTYEGTGIGLALTKELIELHKGKIEVESEEGKGSTFKLYFPLGNKHYSADEICPEESIIDSDKIIVDEFSREDKIISKTISVDDEIIIKNKNLPILLIIDDNAYVRTYICKILESEYNICEAIDGEDGFEKSINEIPDLIISDIMMPKMDGFELCSKLKMDIRTSHIPLILLTAKATLDDKISGLEFGADDYIMKPFEAFELKARIKNLLEQRKRLHEHYNKNGLLNFNDHKVTSQDQIFLEKLTSAIIENLSDSNYSVEILAENLLVSKSLLLKKTEALTGKSPNELIRRIRLTKAAKLLENNFGNISQIGLEVGFNNPSYFAECFKKQFGVTPSQYSKTNQ